MKLAINTIINSQIGYLPESSGVHQTTLERYVHKKRYIVLKYLDRKKPVLTSHQEQEIVKYLRDMDAILSTI